LASWCYRPRAARDNRDLLRIAQEVISSVRGGNAVFWYDCTTQTQDFVGLIVAWKRLQAHADLGRRASRDGTRVLAPRYERIVVPSLFGEPLGGHSKVLAALKIDGKASAEQRTYGNGFKQRLKERELPGIDAPGRVGVRAEVLTSHKPLSGEAQLLLVNGPIVVRRRIAESGD
jgi:hypothetical protein